MPSRTFSKSTDLRIDPPTFCIGGRDRYHNTTDQFSACAKFCFLRHAKKKLLQHSSLFEIHPETLHVLTILTLTQLPGLHVTWVTCYLGYMLPGLHVAWVTCYLGYMLPGLHVTWVTCYLGYRLCRSPPTKHNRLHIPPLLLQPG